MGEADNKDKNESRTIAIVLISLVIVLGVGILLLFPMATDFVEVYLSPGIGLKTSAVIAFFITITVLVIFAVAAGDGLLGELQFILSGFFAFFVIIWLLIAWIF